MILTLVPNTFIYIYNFIRYSLKYRRSIVSPRSFVFDSVLGKSTKVCGGVYLHNCQVGDYTYISGTEAGGLVTNIHNTIIGSYCSLGNHIEIITENSHLKDNISTFPFYSIKGTPYFNETNNSQKTTIKPVTLGHDVWVGSNVTILPGITIADGAIVGAGSVVTRNVDPYTIVAGNPAKIIGTRFNPEQIKQLLKISWWHGPEDKIHRNLDII
ncbi:MAG TPA: CatB-related O-acetyltransferase, partial [Patescibacteria group bacterium]